MKLQTAIIIVLGLIALYYIIKNVIEAFKFTTVYPDPSELTCQNWKANKSHNFDIWYFSFEVYEGEPGALYWINGYYSEVTKNMTIYIDNGAGEKNELEDMINSGLIYPETEKLIRDYISENLNK